MQLRSGSRRLRSLSGCLAAAFLGVAVVAPALAGPRNDDPAEQRITAYDARIPGCSDAGVIGEIAGEFARREVEFWNSTLTITGIDRIAETNFRPWGADFIPRRFCKARVQLSDQRITTVSYSVREKLGFIMWTYDVNWCLTGLDRHKTYAPECTMARP
jgi:hypothetical protein